jgi:hypothetical protein
MVDWTDHYNELMKIAAKAPPVKIPAGLALEIDRAMLFALASLGDTDAVLELGHFGNMTHDEAISRLKAVRQFLRGKL